MLGFSPFKKHANKFNYTPRYYDPEKEAREQRRAELYGQRSDDDPEYKPGQYIRTQREARGHRRSEYAGHGRRNVWKLGVQMLVLVLVLLVVFQLYPRIVEAFIGATRQRAVPRVEETFDPYKPITIVPNDYVEEE